MQTFGVDHASLLWVGDWAIENGVATAKTDFCRVLICFKGTYVKLTSSGKFDGALDGGEALDKTEYTVTDGEHTLFITAMKGFCLEKIESQELIDVKAYYGKIMDEEYASIQAGREPDSTENWKSVDFAAKFPVNGVKLGGFFEALFERNIARIKAAFASPLFVQDQHSFWQFWLPASVEARLIGGAANTLHWQEDTELRHIMNTLVDKVAWQMRDDGYYNYYREKESYELNSLINSERKNYDRTIWTYAMLAAHKAGNPKALQIVRRMYDWLANSNWCKNLLLGGNSTNALMGSLYLADSEAGTLEDVQFNQRFLDQHFWEEMLKQQNPAAFSHYPGERPHCYDLLELLSLVYEYRITGNEQYKEALMGGWQVYRRYYKHLGGATAICEEDGPYPPGSYYITRGHNGETCGSVFWIWLNEQLQQLYPDNSEYAAEIEESLLNILPSAFSPAGNTRSHNRLQGKKDVGCKEATCCEVMSIFLLADLPKYVYTANEQGVWINQYISADVKEAPIEFSLHADFWDTHKASICVQSAPETEQFIKLRIPDWSVETKITLNGKEIPVDVNRGFVSICRVWQEGDRIELAFSAQLRCVRYTGAEQPEDGAPRYGMMYGPYLLACVGYEGEDTPRLSAKADSLDWQKCGQTILLKSDPKVQFVPYYLVEDEQNFSCFPIFAE